MPCKPSQLIAAGILAAVRSCAAVTALAHGTALQVFPFQRQQWNVQGDVLVLDAGSMTPGDSPLASPYMSDDECNNVCARTPGCNAWVYCNSEQGCGSGCKDYTKQNPSCEYMLTVAAAQLRL